MATGRDGPLEAIKLAWACRAEPEVQRPLSPALSDWTEHSDIAVSTLSSQLSAVWAVATDPTARDLPAFYTLAIEDDDEFRPRRLRAPPRA
jgi:hypothetical protein